MKTTKATLIERIQQCIEPSFRDFLIEQIKPAIRIKTLATSSETSALSKIGGVPWVKKGTTWKLNEQSRLPYLFLMQIDLATIRPFDLDQELPAKGLLSFYFDSNSWMDGKVEYAEDIDALEPAPIPQAFKDEQARQQLPFWKRLFTKPKDLVIFKSCDVVFQQNFNTPSWDSIYTERFIIEHQLQDTALILDEAFIDDYTEEDQVTHQLLGYYTGLQESMYELGLGEERFSFPRKVPLEDLRKAQAWRLLAQIDSDKLAQMNWLDAGKILFFIKTDDLKNANFNDVKVVVDST